MKELIQSMRAKVTSLCGGVKETPPSTVHLGTHGGNLVAWVKFDPPPREVGTYKKVLRALLQLVAWSTVGTTLVDHYHVSLWSLFGMVLVCMVGTYSNRADQYWVRLLAEVCLPFCVLGVIVLYQS